MAGDGSYADRFGEAVALDGDTALVGAPGEGRDEDETGTDIGRGAAYVFVRSGAAWTEQQKLAAGDGGGAFGASVAVSAGSALIGAPENDGRGAAYVFTRSGASWSEQESLAASDGAAYDRFGGSVALRGDVALIGTGGGGDGTEEYRYEGAAYVFTRSGTSWSEQQKLVPRGRVRQEFAAEWFGCSVALSAEAAAVGSYRYEDGSHDACASAYVFLRFGAGWSQQRRLVAGALDPTAMLTSVALAGDDVVVGSPDDRGASSTGKAYVFGIVLTLDTVAPRTVAKLPSGWTHDPPVTVSFSAADASGIDRTSYRLGKKGDFEVYDPQEAVKVSAEGATPLEYYSVDYAGNVEPTRTTSVQTDTRPPTKTQAFPARAVTGGQVKLRYRVEDPVPGSGRAKVTINFLVRGHSVKSIRIPGTPASNVTNTYAWRCTLPRGSYEILVTATDLAGNYQEFFSAHTAKLTVR